jgi:hypothetical protein
MLVGLALMATGVLADRATADDTSGYNDKVTSVEGSMTYDSAANQTTFVFKLSVSEQVSHVTITSCPEGNQIVSSAGPSGTKTETGKDPSTNHTGVKFEPGKAGTYTVVFSGNVSGANFIVKNGSGHKHYTIGTGSGCSGTAVTTSSTTTTSGPTGDTATTSTTA